MSDYIEHIARIGRCKSKRIFIFSFIKDIPFTNDFILVLKVALNSQIFLV